MAFNVRAEPDMCCYMPVTKATLVLIIFAIYRAVEDETTTK